MPESAFRSIGPSGKINYNPGQTVESAAVSQAGAEIKNVIREAVELKIPNEKFFFVFSGITFVLDNNAEGQLEVTQVYPELEKAKIISDHLSTFNNYLKNLRS